MKSLELQVSALFDEITRLKRQNKRLEDRIDQLESDVMFLEHKPDSDGKISGCFG